MDIHNLKRLDHMTVELKAHPAELMSMVDAALEYSQSMAEKSRPTSEAAYIYFHEKAFEYRLLREQLQIYLDT